jgi:hypothetical protein
MVQDVAAHHVTALWLTLEESEHAVVLARYTAASTSPTAVYGSAMHFRRAGSSALKLPALASDSTLFATASLLPYTKFEEIDLSGLRLVSGSRARAVCFLQQTPLAPQRALHLWRSSPGTCAVLAHPYGRLHHCRVLRAGRHCLRRAQNALPYGS